MAAPTIAKKTVGLAVRIFAETLYLADPRAAQTRCDIAFDIELIMTRLAVCEKMFVGWVVVGEPLKKPGVYLIAFLRDARPDGTDDARPVRPQCLHRHNSVVGDAGYRTLPSGVGGSDYASFIVGEQDRHAICGDDPEQDAGHIGDHRVRFRRVILIICLGDGNHVGGVDLVNAGKLCIGQDNRGCQPPVFQHGGAVIIAADADIQSGINARRNATLSTKEPVRAVAQRARFNNFYAHETRFSIISPLQAATGFATAVLDGA